MSATSGIGMPFIYFEKDDNDEVEIQVNSGTISISNEVVIIENASYGADFVFYAPVGSTWTQTNNVLRSTLDGKNYWSMAMVPQDETNITAIAEEYKQYAYVFPSETSTTWNYDESSAVVTTTFNVVPEIKEGNHSNVLLGLLPHQWSHLASNSPTPEGYNYNSVRGELKTLAGNSFVVENNFKGILPTLPYLANYSNGFSPVSKILVFVPFSKSTYVLVFVAIALMRCMALRTKRSAIKIDCWEPITSKAMSPNFTAVPSLIKTLRCSLGSTCLNTLLAKLTPAKTPLSLTTSLAFPKAFSGIHAREL